MYTEENEKRGFPLRDFLLKLILVIIFVLLLVWLVPWPVSESLDSLKAQIFNNNIQTMKEAAIPYFTTERLPVNVGDKKTLTLQEMLDLKLLIPFVDKDNKSCDTTASYVTLEKLENEYLMKVNLKCGNQENYILVHMGCYSYCKDTICQNKDVVTPTPKPTNKPGVPPTTSKPNKPSTPKPKPSPTPKVTPTPTPTNIPNPSPKPSPKPTPTSVPTPTPAPNKQYQYKKHFEAKYSAWSEWKTYAYKDSDNIVFGYSNTKEVVDLGAKKIQVGTKSAVYQNYSLTRDKVEQVGQVTYEVCSDWDYVINKTSSTTTTGTGSVHRVLSNWRDTGQYYRGYDVPNDTNTRRYIYVGIDYKTCGNTCTNHPYLIWKVQTRNVSSQASRVTTTTEGKVTVEGTCVKKETKQIPINIVRKITETHREKITDAQPVYGYVKFYRVRNRQIISAGYTKYTWSTHNDRSLLDIGYTYTGSTRKAR